MLTPLVQHKADPQKNPIHSSPNTLIFLYSKTLVTPIFSQFNSPLVSYSSCRWGMPMLAFTSQLLVMWGHFLKVLQGKHLAQPGEESRLAGWQQLQSAGGQRSIDREIGSWGELKHTWVYKGRRTAKCLNFDHKIAVAFNCHYFGDIHCHHNFERLLNKWSYIKDYLFAFSCIWVPKSSWLIYSLQVYLSQFPSHSLWIYLSSSWGNLNIFITLLQVDIEGL